MPDNKKYTDSIHAYLKGEMDEDTLMKFEEEMAKNPELANEIQWHRDFQDVMLIEEEKHLKKQIKQLIEEEKKQETKISPLKSLGKSRSPYLALAIAAMLLLAIGLAFFLVPTNEKPLLAKHLETPYFSSPDKTRGNGEQDWIKAYQLKKYAEATAILTQKEQANGLTTEQKFYLGLSYLYQETNQISRAIEYLKTAKQENPVFYENTCNWYIALAYLKNQQEETAKKYLQEIIAAKAWKHQEAQELLLHYQ